MTFDSKKIFLFCLMLFAHLAATNVAAQVVYSCDFENAADRTAWTLNQKPANRPQMVLENMWYFGTPGQFGATGQYGLFISNDGINPNYSATGDMFVTAYVPVPALTAGVQHTIRFDYRLAGSTSAKMDVWWVPQTVNPVSNTSAAPNYAGSKNGIKLASGLYGSAAWKCHNYVFTPSQSTPGRLVFVWISSQGGANPPSACVDNIELIQGDPCATAPTGLQYNDRLSTLSWAGTATQYEVCNYNQSTDQVTPITAVTGKSTTMTFTAEGHYDLYVRAVCPDGSHSAWTSLSHFVWIPGQRCIDYFDYGGNIMNKGVCYVGSHSSSSSHTSLSFNVQPQIVDNGSSSPSSMHTLHTDLGEIDPNTTANGGLRTVPPGEIASIRLGAYTSSGQDARIEYKYKVPEGQQSLVDLQYACVLQSGGHSADNPFFQLEILDSKGRQIEGCTHAYFVADMSGTSGSGWHQEGDIYWCDWRTVTVSLSKYEGQQLTIRLTSSRCVYDTHFGYAYFTLNCRNGGLQGLACGDYTTDHFEAPEGDFTYRWYYRSDSLRTRVLSTDRVFDIPENSDTIYVVEVINHLGGENCSFELVANPNPRLPVARAVASPVTDGCENIVTFANSSQVVYMNRRDSSQTIADDEIVEDVIWDFGDGSPLLHDTAQTVTHYFPQEGGVFDVRVSAVMGTDQACSGDTVIHLVLPKLGTLRDTLVDMRCKDGNPYVFNGKNYYDTFIDSIVTPLRTGCDSVHYASINFVENLTSEFSDTICAEVKNYTYMGQNIIETGDYEFHTVSSLGCDSLITLHMHVRKAPEIRVDSIHPYCADDVDGLILPINMKDLEPVVDSIKVFMDPEAVANGFRSVYAYGADEKDAVQVTWPSDILPNVYTGRVEFSSPWCMTYAYDIRIELNYPSSALDQKNGLVACMNEGYNGGYSFVSYQWYRDGELVEGATDSYLRVSDEEDMNHEYYVVVLRDSDNVVLRSCPIKYTGGGRRSDINDLNADLWVNPTSLYPGQDIHVSSAQAIRVTDLLGRIVATYPASSCGQQTIPAPAQPGVYFINTSSEKTVRILVH